MMVPLRRCGSNAIRLRMNLHPGFYSPYPLHLSDLVAPSAGDLSDDAVYRQLVGVVVGVQQNSLVPWEGVSFDADSVFRSVSGLPRSIHQVHWHMLLEAGRAHGARVVMDKSQDGVCGYAELLSLFPDMLFVDVVRDPRAQVSSMNDAIIYDFDTRLNTERWVGACRPPGPRPHDPVRGFRVRPGVGPPCFLFFCGAAVRPGRLGRVGVL